MNVPESSIRCSRLLCNSSRYEKLPAVLPHVQLDQRILFFATTDVPSDDLPKTSGTCRSIVCFLKYIIVHL
jgi:hypothetical protein